MFNLKAESPNKPWLLTPQQGRGCNDPWGLAGLETQTQSAAFFERKWPKRKLWHREKSLNRKKNDRNAVFWTLAFYHARP